MLETRFLEAESRLVFNFLPFFFVSSVFVRQSDIHHWLEPSRPKNSFSELSSVDDDVSIISHHKSLKSSLVRSNSRYSVSDYGTS